MIKILLLLTKITTDSTKGRHPRSSVTRTRIELKLCQFRSKKNSGVSPSRKPSHRLSTSSSVRALTSLPRRVLGKMLKLDSSTLWRRPPTSRIIALEEEEEERRLTIHFEILSQHPVLFVRHPVSHQPDSFYYSSSSTAIKTLALLEALAFPMERRLRSILASVANWHYHSQKGTYLAYSNFVLTCKVLELIYCFGVFFSV